MNNLLIDSHIFIWLLHNPKKIGKNTKDLIIAANKVFVSQASIFELTLKYKKGKLGDVNAAVLLRGVTDLGLEQLQIKDNHLVSFSESHSPNKDPFDGLLLAQAESEGLLLLTSDKVLLGSKSAYILDARI